MRLEIVLLLNPNINLYKKLIWDKVRYSAADKTLLGSELYCNYSILLHILCFFLFWGYFVLSKRAGLEGLLLTIDINLRNLLDKNHTFVFCDARLEDASFPDCPAIQHWFILMLSMEMIHFWMLLQWDLSSDYYVFVVSLLWFPETGIFRKILQ